jgi:hypothetical protein
MIMAGRGMGAATKGGGCVESGPRNKMMSKTSNTSGPVMMKEGGIVEGMKEVLVEGAKKVGEDVQRIAGTARGKELDKQAEKDMYRRASNAGMKAAAQDLRNERVRAEAGRYKAGGSVSKGAINQHKRMAMGKKMMGGGMVKGYKKGGAC